MQSKNEDIQGAGYLGQNDITWGQPNTTGMPLKQKSKQNWVKNLSLYKHLFIHSEISF